MVPVSERDGRATYRCIWCELEFDADPEECIGCPYCLRHNVTLADDVHECDGCGFVGPKRVADYYGTEIAVCRSCGQELEGVDADA